MQTGLHSGFIGGVVPYRVSLSIGRWIETGRGVTVTIWVDVDVTVVIPDADTSGVVGDGEGHKLLGLIGRANVMTAKLAAMHIVATESFMWAM